MRLNNNNIIASNINGNINLLTNGSGTINITGDTILNNNLNVTGSGEITGTLTCSNLTDFGLIVDGNAHIDGNLTVNGAVTTIESNIIEIKDNLLIVNGGPDQSRDGGFLIGRYQTDNDIGTGDIVSDVPLVTNTLPDQTGLSSTSVKLAASSSSITNYYANWYIKITSGANNNQVRQIITYNGTSKVAVLSSAWTSQNPSIGSSYSLYANIYIASFYNESNKEWVIASTDADPHDDPVNVIEYIPLHVKGINIEDSLKINNTNIIDSNFNLENINNITSNSQIIPRQNGSIGDYIHSRIINPTVNAHRYLLLRLNDDSNTGNIIGTFYGKRQNISGNGKNYMRLNISITVNNVVSEKPHVYYEVDYLQLDVVSVVYLDFGGNQWIAIDTSNIGTFTNALQNGFFNGYSEVDITTFQWKTEAEVSNVQNIPAEGFKDFSSRIRAYGHLIPRQNSTNSNSFGDYYNVAIPRPTATNNRYLLLRLNDDSTTGSLLGTFYGKRIDNSTNGKFYMRMNVAITVNSTTSSNPLIYYDVDYEANNAARIVYLTNNVDSLQYIAIDTRNDNNRNTLENAFFSGYTTLDPSTFQWKTVAEVSNVQNIPANGFKVFSARIRAPSVTTDEYKFNSTTSSIEGLSNGMIQLKCSSNGLVECIRDGATGTLDILRCSGTTENVFSVNANGNVNTVSYGFSTSTANLKVEGENLLLKTPSSGNGRVFKVERTGAAGTTVIMNVQDRFFVRYDDVIMQGNLNINGNGFIQNNPISSVYTGNTANNLSYPIGTVIGARGNQFETRNSSKTVRLVSDWGFTTISSSGSVLSGTWRFRGFAGSDASAYNWLMQRTA
jgi:hypothetical protein